MLNVASSPVRAGRLTSSLNAISTLNHISLKRHGTSFGVQLEEKTASIAEDIAVIITAPERCGACTTIAADGLEECQLAC